MFNKKIAETKKQTALRYSNLTPYTTQIPLIPQVSENIVLSIYKCQKKPKQPSQPTNHPQTQ